VHENQPLRISARLSDFSNKPTALATRDVLIPRDSQPSLACDLLRPAYRKFRHLNSFNDFGLAEPITRALAEEKYVTPTPIQAQAIPLLVSGRDLIGIAQTGTGKTAAFALPVLNHLATKRMRPEPKTCRVLVLSPTRELSGQILESFRTYGRHLRMQTTLAIGGVPMGRQIRALAHGVDVLVATPGRLLDLVQSRALRFDRIDTFVLDEADRMLDMGFINDIRKIIAKLPAERQTLLFSATMPKDIAELAGQMLKDPAKVSVAPVATTAERIAQRVVHLDRGAKPKMLTDIIREEQVDRAIIFTRTKHGADKVVRGLIKDGIAADAIHGNKSQNQRERVLADFRNGRVRTLVATDIAARGIDVDGISHVINFDVPNVPESYVHRIGRTARAGAEGIAISLCSSDEVAFLRDIERLIRMSIPATGDVPASRPQRPPQQQRSRNGQQRPHQSRDGEARHQNGSGRGPKRNGRGQDRNQDRNPDRNQNPDQGRNRQHAGGGNQERRPEHSQERNQKPAQHGRQGQQRPVQESGDFTKVAFMQAR
jgi:ATP-dependent RNA helicase RhlE